MIRSMFDLGEIRFRPGLFLSFLQTMLVLSSLHDLAPDAACAFGKCWNSCPLSPNPSKLPCCMPSRRDGEKTAGA